VTGSTNGRELLDHHRELLAASAISEEVAFERGYWSATKKVELEELGFGRAAQRVPALVIPIHGITGDLEWCAHRPDEPRIVDGRVCKYEIPRGVRQVLDIPERVRPRLNDPRVPLVITEGPRKVDAAISHGLTCIGVFGTYAFRGTNPETDGKLALADWEYVALKNSGDEGRDVYVCFDSDVMRKPEVQDAFDRLSALLHRRGGRVRYILLPEGELGTKTGLDDYLANGGTVEELWSFSTSERPHWLRPKDRGPDAPQPKQVPAKTLAEVEETFRRRLHLPTLQPLHVTLGTIAANRLPGEPVWTVLVGPSGCGKSEDIRACNDLPDIAIVTTLSEPGLLSGTNRREWAEDATGGVLCQIGALGILSFKDLTSTLSLDKDAMHKMLAALREIYDGYWSRDVGAEGGRKLFWQGKAGLIGGVTPAIDRAHAVIAEMGERLLLHRFPEIGVKDEILAIRKAIRNHKELEAMRVELRDAVSGLFIGRELSARPITKKEQRLLIRAAMLVVRGRAAVHRDSKRELVDVGAPEIPTRLAQQLERLLAGMDAIGVPRDEAWKATVHTALSSMPADRLRVLRFLYEHGESSTTNVRVALARPTNSVHRTLDDLTALGLVRLVAPGGQGKVDIWALAESAARAFQRLERSVQPPEKKPDVAPRAGGMGIAGEVGEVADPTSPEIPTGVRDPRGDAQDGSPAATSSPADKVGSPADRVTPAIRLVHCPVCNVPKAIDKRRAGLVYLVCGHNVADQDEAERLAEELTELGQLPLGELLERSGDVPEGDRDAW
jgi:DNA-binding MarR family transcriptional regulator